MNPSSDGFARPVATFIAPFLGTLAERLGQVRGLGEAERAVVHAAADAALRNNAQAKLNRVLLLELFELREGPVVLADADQRVEAVLGGAGPQLLVPGDRVAGELVVGELLEGRPATTRAPARTSRPPRPER